MAFQATGPGSQAGFNPWAQSTPAPGAPAPGATQPGMTPPPTMGASPWVGANFGGFKMGDGRATVDPSRLAQLKSVFGAGQGGFSALPTPGGLPMNGFGGFGQPGGGQNPFTGGMTPNVPGQQPPLQQQSKPNVGQPIAPQPAVQPQAPAPAGRGDPNAWMLADMRNQQYNAHRNNMSGGRGSPSTARPYGVNSDGRVTLMNGNFNMSRN